MKLWCVLLLMASLSLGCSDGGGILTSPQNASPQEQAYAGAHMLWGLWQFTADPAAKTLDTTPLRIPDMHLNALPFLEPPLLVNLTLESLEFNGDVIDADIGLRHPFLGLVEFTGFDVCGILITRGSAGGFTDSGINLPGPDDLRLLNPDGYSRWWNPTEFPVNDGSMFCYKDGLLGSPHSIGQFTATLNGYKYFCADLSDPDDPMSVIDTSNRGAFLAGEKIVRHYSIKLGAAGLIFNYAVDANWQFPVGPKPWTIPDDFPPAANRPEAWWLDTEVTKNTLFCDETVCGGELGLKINVHDWYNVDLDTVNVESPGNFDPVTDIPSTGGGEGYSTHEILIKYTTPAFGQIDVLIAAECEMDGYGGFLPGKKTTAYSVITVPVSPASEPLDVQATVTVDKYFDGFGPPGTSDDPIPLEWCLTLDASASTGPITDFLWEMNGDDLFDDASGEVVSAAFPDTGTHVIKLKAESPLGDKILEFPGSYTVVDNTAYVWAAFTGTSDGSRATPWTTITAALSDVGTNGYILVRGDDATGGQCEYSTNLTLTSTNAGTRIQGYYGDIDTDEPPMQTGYVRVEGDNITFDGFEVTGPSAVAYSGSTHYGKLGVLGGNNALFRHIFIHDINRTTEYCKAICIWTSGSLTAQNVLESDIKASYLSNQISGNFDPKLTFINCTMDRLYIPVYSYSLAVYFWSGVGHVHNSIWTDCNTHVYFQLYGSAGAVADAEYTNTYENPAIPPNGSVSYYVGVTKGPNCITVSPLYVDYLTDHHLQSGSPCIDTGDPDPAYNDPDGTRNDMGCYGGPYGDWDFEN